MICSFRKYFLYAAVLMAAAQMASPGWSMTLVSPTADQVVHGKVKVIIPVSALPDKFFDIAEMEKPFISIYVGQPGSESFFQALSAGAVVRDGDIIAFMWDTKAAYHDASDAKKDKFFKDGAYSLRIDIHEQTTNKSRVLDSGSVNIMLKNKLDRTNPAPGVSLVNNLSRGDQNIYKFHTEMQMFDSVGLPILGTMGLSGDFRVVQSVEDVRPNGDIMMRARLDNNSPVAISLFGERAKLYEYDKVLPNVYRLMNKYGEVLTENIFRKQAEFSVTDVLPVLPKTSVKEGDSWPSQMNLKLEGLTDMIRLSGPCSLDSFEWEGDTECVKLVSKMEGSGIISVNGNKIRSGSTIKAYVVTYFAYKTGKMVSRIITLDFPVSIEAGAGEKSGSLLSTDPNIASGTRGPTGTGSAIDDDMGRGLPKAPGGIMGLPRTPVGGAATTPTTSSGPTTKGSALMTVTIIPEK
ncbi:MAG: hypothetical protein NT018_04285 [Armatimonadetes bacterium]|nr:hypothetical protein [Armatimonadota bacterium]